MSNFYIDTIQKSPVFNSRGRVNDPGLLEPNVRRKVEAIIVEAKAHGLNLMIFETYRSQARQGDLFAQGASQLQKVGVHHFDLACDLVKDVSGEPSWKGSFDLLGHLASAHELIWGGNWGRPDIQHSFIDEPHVQWCSVRDQGALFNSDWYPDVNYNPYKHL